MYARQTAAAQCEVAAQYGRDVCVRLGVRLTADWYNTLSVQSTHCALSLVSLTASGEVEREK